MSKEYLEALEHIYYGSQGYGETDKYYKYLKDYLESIDNAEPSEALNGLEDIYRNAVFISDYDVFGKQHPTNISPETNKSISVQCDTIKQALLKAQKEHKVLEIIKEKKVDMWYLVDLLEQTYEMYLAFCKSEKYEEDYILTQEEFNTLKEALE